MNDRSYFGHRSIWMRLPRESISHNIFS
jgi:hypothetical protein